MGIKSVLTIKLQFATINLSHVQRILLQSGG